MDKIPCISSQNFIYKSIFIGKEHAVFLSYSIVFVIQKSWEITLKIKAHLLHAHFHQILHKWLHKSLFYQFVSISSLEVATGQ